VNQFSKGDQVRIDIPDKDDPDFDRLHGQEGTVVAVIEDDAGAETGDIRDSILYRVVLAGREESVDVRWRDLRPA
jgi:hypothetical protein